MSDRIFGAFGIALAFVYAFAASMVEESFLTDTVGPKTFPYIIATILGICSAMIVLRPDAEPAWPVAARLTEIAAAVVVMILYARALPLAGFVIASSLAAAYLSWRLGSRLLSALVSGVGISVGIYVVFHLVLGLSLARGPLGF